MAAGLGWHIDGSALVGRRRTQHAGVRNLDLGIAGRKALVMASSSGLGFACAIALAREGVQVTLNSRNAERLAAAGQTLFEQTAQRCASVVADITTSEGRDAVFEVVPAVDILITNNAGPAPGDLSQWDRDAWISAFDHNMIPQALFIRHYVPGMRERRFGRIVNITSAMVKSPRPHMALSSAARTALTAFSKALSLEVAKDNVTLNNLLPERIDTPRQSFMAERMMAAQSISLDEARRRIAETIAARRMGEPAEFADACVYLCAAQSGFVSGQNLQVDGGSYPGLL
ncbi:MAG TPA: SDR family oxidoreductase [Burkholderiaceae bacterium]|nr:SDR family oxidoreductase [Burkholderiaceae bacterium]